MSTCINASLGQCVVAVFAVFFYILKLSLVFNKLLIKPLTPFKQVQIFLIYFMSGVVHVIKQIVNPSNWGWNRVQEIL